MPKKYRFFFVVSMFFAAAAFGVPILLNSWKIDSVRVVLKQGAREPCDVSFAKIGKDEAAPDYNLAIRLGKKWMDCGTYANTGIGEGLEYKIQGLAPTFLAREIRWVEKDKLNSDLLEQLPIGSDHLVGNSFEFHVERAFDLEAGFAWFFDTRLGKIVSAAIGMALFVSLSVAILANM